MNLRELIVPLEKGDGREAAGGRSHKTLRPCEIAKRDGVSVRTVYRWVRERKIPPEKFRKVTVTVERIEIDEDVRIGRFDVQRTVLS